MRTITKLLVFVVLGLASAAPARAQSFDVLANFSQDIGMPTTKLLLASDGYLYGTTVAGGDYGYGSVFRVRPNGTGFETVHSFSNFDGASPSGELIEYAGGIYGMTQGGGGVSLNSGTIFRIDAANPLGAVVVHTFNYADPNNGGFPTGGLLEWNGLLYGMTAGGGAHDRGTVFAFDPGTTSPTHSILYSFKDTDVGQFPVGSLVEQNGLLYGVTQRGGQQDAGTLFRIDGLGLLYETLEQLGGYPHAGLLKVGTDLYGTTQQGGNGGGSIFKFDTTTDTFEYVHFFNANTPGEALYPVATLMQASNGRLYGTTEGGGANNSGALFEMDPTTDPPTVIVKHSFVRDVTGRRPVAGVVQAGSSLYGTTSERGPGFNGTVFGFNLSTGVTTVLHAFGPTGPYQPIGQPIEAGPALIGASANGGPLRGGTVFKWDSATSSVSILHTFDLPVEGGFPTALIQGSDGRLYGTASIGGPTTCGPFCITQFPGIVFSMDANGGNFTTLRSFDASGPYAPSGRLLEAGGVLYGTLTGGGTHEGGAVFRMTTAGGGFQILHEFDPSLDGSMPTSGVTLGSDGLLYGTTSTGGEHGAGATFRMDTAGGSFEVLHAFDVSNPFDGANPHGGLVEIRPNLFMGTTTNGGIHSGSGLFGGGTVYKLEVSTSPPTFAVLRSFENCCPAAYGLNPSNPLVKGAGGWAYGMNTNGGPTDFAGTIYAVNTNGTTRLLHELHFAEGSGPVGALTIAADGSLYGATRYGGTNWGGVLFRLRLDSDGDGVRDPIDNCPTSANPSQTDTDGDGIGDGCPVDIPTKPLAKLTLGNLQFTYDGTPKATSVATLPIEAAETGVITVTYNGSTTPPTNAGIYTVVASLANPNYATSDATGQLVISRATPLITWNNPADIFNPAPLTAAQLNATANVPGSFVYAPDFGAVLPIANSHLLTVEFTPTDQGNYNAVSASVTIRVRGLVALDTTPPVVAAPDNISVLATHATGAFGYAVYYPWAGKPLPTLADFLASATATDDLSQPVQLPTELFNCVSGVVIDADTDASTSFPIGTGINCVRFRFRDDAGNIGEVIRQVTVHPGTVTTSSSTMPINAVAQNGMPSGVTVEFTGGVTGSGTTAASCQRNASTTTAADFIFDVKPVYPECGNNPDGTPRTCGAPAGAFGSSYTISCDISTTAQFQGLIKVCFPHVYGRDTLWHWNATTKQWEDITIRPVLANQPICGYVTSLSPFIVNAMPELLLPSNLTVEAASAAGKAVGYSATAVDPEDGSLPANCTPVSGTVFPLGTTVVACSAADASGVSETASFSVNVVDTTPPAVTAPAPITVDATQSNGARGASSPALAQWLASGTAADLVDPEPTGGAQASASTVFPIGTTTVTFRFVDKSGNAGTATSTVTVVGSGSPRMLVSVAGRGIVSGTKQYVDLAFSNTGGARALRANALVIPVTVKGYGVIKVVSPGQPIALGDVAPGATRTVRVVLNVPTTVKEFLLIEAGVFWTSNGTPVAFGDTQTLPR